MRKRLFVMLIALITMVLMPGGVFAQDVPEEPEAPETPAETEVAEAAEEAGEPEEAEAAAGSEASDGPPSMTFSATVDFEPVKKITLDGQAGEIELRGVEFTVSKAKGGVLGTSDADLKATIGVLLECSTEAEKKAKFDLTVHFLDAEGAIIDRVDNGIGLKPGSKIIESKVTTLKYVVPLIESARITAVAK